MTSLHLSATHANLSDLEQQYKRKSVFVRAQRAAPIHELPSATLFNILHRTIKHSGSGPLPHPTKQEFKYLAKQRFGDLKSELTAYVKHHPAYLSDLSDVVEALFCYHLLALHFSKQLNFQQLLIEWAQQLSKGQSVEDIIKEVYQSNPTLYGHFISYSYKRLKIALHYYIPPGILAYKNECDAILKGLCAYVPASHPIAASSDRDLSTEYGSFFNLSAF